MGRSRTFASVSTGAITTGVSSGVNRALIEPRDGEIIRLLGYRFWLHPSAAQDVVFNEFQVFHAGTFLMASNHDWGLSSVNMLLPTGPRAQLVDFYTILDDSVVHRADATGHWSLQWQYRTSSDWTETDLDLPELGIYVVSTYDSATGAGSDPALIGRGGVLVEYEYKKAGASKIAEVNFQWGRDPIDVENASTP